MRKNLVILAAALAAAAALTACGGQAEETTAAETAAETTAEESAEAEETSAEEETEAAKADGELETVTVGASPAPHAEILEAAKEAMAEKGYDLEIVEYVDYVQPNLALDSGDLTANYFQHITYLEDFNAERGTHLASAGSIHYEPFGIYAGKTASLEELADGAQIAVPNDATNEARALLLLEAQGLITLDDSSNLTATPNNIVDNPKNLEFQELEAATIPSVLADVDLAVINSNYALGAGLNPTTDALAIESSDSPYVNVLVVKEGNEDNEAVQALVEALHSDAIRDFITEEFDGAVVPAF